MSASSEIAVDMDNVLVFLTRDLRGTLIARVLLHTTAAAMYPQYVDAVTGRIPESATTPRNDDDVVFHIYKASSLAIPAELIRTLLGLHAQELDYERLSQYSRVEGYGDWLNSWCAATRAAVAYLSP